MDPGRFTATASTPTCHHSRRRRVEFMLSSEVGVMVAMLEGIYAGTGVVRYGNLITSVTCPYLARETGKPDRTAALTLLFVEAIPAITVRRLLNRYCKQEEATDDTKK